jgi:hypothetical protein
LGERSARLGKCGEIAKFETARRGEHVIKRQDFEQIRVAVR